VFHLEKITIAKHKTATESLLCSPVVCIHIELIVYYLIFSSPTHISHATCLPLFTRCGSRGKFHL